MEDQTGKILFLLGQIKGEVKGMKEQLIKQNSTLKTHGDQINKNENDIVAGKAKATLLGAMAGIIVSSAIAAVSWFKLK